MNLFYSYKKDECENMIDILQCAQDVWCKNLPEGILRGSVAEKIHEVEEKLFGDEKETGEISDIIADDILIPAIEAVYSNKEIFETEELERLCMSFTCTFDGEKLTLYDRLKSKIAKREREERLGRTFDTKEEAIKDGIEEPFEYRCWECGKSFWAQWRSDYSPAAICPICSTENR